MIATVKSIVVSHHLYPKILSERDTMIKADESLVIIFLLGTPEDTLPVPNLLFWDQSDHKIYNVHSH